MAIGINLTQNVRVELGEIKEHLFNDLISNNIEYDVPFDKVNKDNVKETIVHIKELGTEISVENDIITYIKSGNNSFTCIDNIKTLEDNTLEHLQRIKSKIRDKFDNELYTIKIEKLDATTLNITLILSSSIEKARINILRDANGAVFVNTIRAIA